MSLLRGRHNPAVRTEVLARLAFDLRLTPQWHQKVGDTLHTACTTVAVRNAVLPGDYLA